MNDMIILVAAAIMEAHDHGPLLTGDAYTNMAIAAISAMREPSLGMYMRGGGVSPSSGDVRHHNKRIGDIAAKDAWREMIDVALAGSRGVG